MTDLDIVIQELPRLASGFANTLLLFAISTWARSCSAR